MIKHKQPNPLNIFGLRRVEHNPPHFTLVTFDLRGSPKVITDWIFENLEGRFWFGDHYFVDETGVQIQKGVSFERAAEASYFGLILDQINQPTVY